MTDHEIWKKGVKGSVADTIKITKTYDIEVKPIEEWPPELRKTVYWVRIELTSTSRHGPHNKYQYTIDHIKPNGNLDIREGDDRTWLLQPVEVKESVKSAIKTLKRWGM